MLIFAFQTKNGNSEATVLCGDNSEEKPTLKHFLLVVLYSLKYLKIIYFLIKLHQSKADN